MDLLAIGGLAFDHLFRVEVLPLINDATTITNMGVFPGGRAPNVAVMAAALGLKTGIVSLAGDDFRKLGYKRHLQELKVDLRGIVVLPKNPTTRTFIFTNPLGEEVTFVYPGAAKHFSGMKIPQELIEQSKIVHISSCNNTKFETDAVIRTSNSNVTVSYDPGNQPIVPERHLRKILSNTSFLFMNEIEASKISSKLHLENVKNILNLGPQMVVVFNKKQKSSSVYTEEQIVHIPGRDYLDYPTGTSDAFIAGFLAAFVKGYSLRMMGIIGSLEAGIVGQSFGCQINLPSWKDLSRRIRQISEETS